MRTGIDIAQTARFETLSKKDAFLKKVFTGAERDYFASRKHNIKTIAGNFCAKEAFFKALGTGIGPFGFLDVAVLRDAHGKPYFSLSQPLNAFIKTLGITQFDVSISHDGGYAVASVAAHCDARFSAYVHAAKKSETNDAGVISNALAKSILPVRSQNSHKGSFGKDYIVAGSKGLTGAAVLCSSACLHSGAGLITLGCPESLNIVFETVLTEVMTDPLPDAGGHLCAAGAERMLARAKKSDAVLFGCGLGNTPDTYRLLEALIGQTCVPLVLDADGINALAGNINILNRHKQELVITPHLVEFTRLAGCSLTELSRAPEVFAAAFSKQYGVTLVLKSHQTLAALPDGRVFKNVLGNSGMATGGSGDVLAGVITAFLGQGVCAQKSALLGVYVHSLAADMAAADKGEYGLTPTDIVKTLPYALNFLGG